MTTSMISYRVLAKDSLKDSAALRFICLMRYICIFAHRHHILFSCYQYFNILPVVNEATETHCYNPVAPAYPVWAYYAHGCQEDPVSLPSGRLEKTIMSSPHHVAQHRPTAFETTPPYAPRSSGFGSEPPLWRIMSTYGATQS